MSFAVPAEAYDRFVGRYSRGLCDGLVEAAGVAAGSSVLDVGAGTGAGTRRLVELLGADRVAAVEPSEPFFDALRERCPGVDVRLGRAESLPFDDGAFDAAIAQLVVNFIPDPAAGVAEMRRVTRSGGAVAACVWDYPGEMPLLRVFWEAGAELDPDGVEAVDERTQMPFARGGELAGFLREVGLGEVEDGEIVVAADYQGFDDLWQPFTEGVGPAGRYAVSLDDGSREALRAEYRRRLSVPDGPFRLEARAWLAVGRA